MSSFLGRLRRSVLGGRIAVLLQHVPLLQEAEAAAAAELNNGVATLTDPAAEADPEGAALAAWSLVHGFALLTLNGAVTDADPVDTAERLARILFSG